MRSAYNTPVRRRTITVTLTQAQVDALALAVNDHRQHLVDNGRDTRALDNGIDRILNEWTARGGQ